MSDISTYGSSSRRNWRAALDVTATIAMLFAAGGVIWNAVGQHDAPASTRPPVAVPTAPLSLDSVPTLGSPSARVVMIISGLPVPLLCAVGRRGLAGLETRVRGFGKGALRVSSSPVARAHARRSGSGSAECARRQDRFWAMHDWLFKPPMRLEEPALQAHALEAGLDLGEFAACMNGAAADRVAADGSIARDLGLMATPTVIIGVVSNDGAVRAQDLIQAGRARSRTSAKHSIARLPASGTRITSNAHRWTRRRSFARWLWGSRQQSLEHLASSRFVVEFSR